MSRKAHKSNMGRSDWQIRRRSPRISAIDACKQNHDDQLHPDKTKSRIKRKFDHHSAAFTSVSKLAKQVWKGRDSQKDADHSTDCAVVEWRSVRESQIHDGHAATNGKASIMPDKHTLELVLDTLQRRDTYEIFAEPVDPDEVEDYYEIIKEPMDFGTMRAKLHEGMYKNLEQFEHDVFLIPENAMHFNSSATIYFRQGRAIHELAKKVFHALKTDPENFVSEFSGTRRRSMRKALSVDPKDSRLFCSTAKSSGTCVGMSSKGTMRSGNNKNNPARNIGDGRLSRSCEVADRRDTYWSLSDLCQENKKPLLLLVNDGDIRYKESLMSYVKDLGPIAQMVAKRKLSGQHESNAMSNGRRWVGSPSTTLLKIQTKKSDNDDHANAITFRTFRDFAPPPSSNPFFLKPIDLTCRDKLGEANNNNNNNNGRKEKTINIPCSSPVVSGNNYRPVVKKGYCSTKNPVMNCSTNTSNSFRLSDDNINVRPVILALENSHSINAAHEFGKTRNKKSISSTSVVASPARPVNNSLVQQMPPRPFSSISQFTFDLPFLKARLNQMNVVPPSFQKGGVDLNWTHQAESLPISNTFLSTRRPSFIDSNLPLQL